VEHDFGTYEVGDHPSSSAHDRDRFGRAPDHLQSMVPEGKDVAAVSDDRYNDGS